MSALTVAVAFSAGRDSLALLHATCRSAAALGIQVVALHVHHGLMPQADDWLSQAQRLCVRWQRRGWPVRLRWSRLSGGPAAGDSTEAWARKARYDALTRMAREEAVSLVLLAQHRRDQAETVLLQALRGGGPAGLSAMPVQVKRNGLVWARPWLEQPKDLLEAYLRRHRLKPVHDPSNADPAYARSRLRTQVWPVLAQAFPDAELCLGAVARRAQEADAVLAEVAQADLPAVSDGAALLMPAWLGLSAARRANVLRRWLAVQPGVVPTESLVQRLLQELARCRTAQWSAGPSAVLRLYRGRLRLGAPSRVDPSPPDAPASADVAGVVLDLSKPGRWPVPGWAGAIEARVATTGGAPADALTQVRVLPRRGGERFALSPHGLPRSLKKQFQAAGIDEPGRQGPLLWAGDQLLWVPGLGIDARAWAGAGVPQLTLHWQPDMPA